MAALGGCCVSGSSRSAALWGFAEMTYYFD